MVFVPGHRRPQLGKFSQADVGSPDALFGGPNHHHSSGMTGRGRLRKCTLDGLSYRSRSELPAQGDEELGQLLELRGHFVAFLNDSYPAHLTALLRLDFERLCRESGFEPPRFSYTNRGAVPKCTALDWQSLSFGLLRGRLFSDNLLMVTRRHSGGAVASVNPRTQTFERLT